MTNREFSDSFTTLLNSYNRQAQFGEQASKAEIVLDEYEKSVILTQAQDIITKSYFDKNYNQSGQGFDDSTRRQVDFSSLIKVTTLTPTSGSTLYDERGVLFKMPRKVVNGHIVEDTTDILFILNEKLLVETTLGDGNPKTWILNNYGDGKIVYYSEPTVHHTDQSHYWMIEGDDEHYYTHPGNPTNHPGNSAYWTIEGDPQYFEYPVYPAYTHHEGNPQYWTINSSQQMYYSEPKVQLHPSTNTYYTIDLDVLEQHYNTYPEIQHTDAIPEYWTISHMGVEDTEHKYYREIEVISGTEASTYYTIDLDPEQTQYENDPGTATSTLVKDEYWTIDLDDPTVEYTTEPDDPVTHQGTDDSWIVNGTDVFPFDPTDEFIYNKESYWTTSATGNTQYATNPVTAHTTQTYWRDTNPDNARSSLYKDYYIISKPTWIMVRASVNGKLPGYYIISNYGEIGPFSNQPIIQSFENSLDYWLIEGDTTNPYFEEVTATETISAESWSITYNNRTYVYNSNPTVQYQAGTPTTYTVTIGSTTNTYYELPTIQHYPAQYTWKFDDIDTIFTSEPHVITHTQGGMYYQVVYVDTQISVNGINYKDPSPVVNHYPGVAEYWTFGSNTYNTEPHVITHPGQQQFWTIDVTGGVQYLTEPIIHTYDATNPYWVINYDGKIFYSEPVITPHNEVASYWTFTGINKKYYTTNPPTVTSMYDPDLSYYTINDESTHYSNEPQFTIIDGVNVGKTKEEYIIVPISYKEYDREMSKPYAQPLKKQAWRLFQNNSLGFDFDSELIPKFSINPHGNGYNIGDVVLTYKIRYVRRPRPIILEDLPNGLEIDGESSYSECELNPILHADILNKAVEIALATRGRVQPQDEQRR